MYLYFDNNGILKEIVDDVATRKGNNEVNRLYIYVDGITPKTEWITYQTSDDVKSNETLIETTITKTIPYDRNRDLKYFKNFQEYLFYVATIPGNVLAVSGLTKASVRVALQDDSLMTLGLIIFTIEDSVVLQDSFITESQYQYLLNIISNFEELNNTGVIGISTRIVNGAVAPYDQGRIVLSTYNDNFTVATVVKNSTNQNVYSVLDMTFVKQVPYNNSNPNLEGLEINGRKYKVAYNTSQLNNDAGFITNAVSNLINYYDKTTVDEKLANIDLSEYYTKTESDGRYVLTTNFSWNNLANKPTSLSDFINDEGFITNTVSNLSNYYDKTTIDNIVATLKTGAFQVVNELPSSGAEGIVYLVGTEAPYTMYIWENNAFLNIGTTEVNLDGYVKGTNLNTNYVILGNGGSNVVASSYTINNQNANDPNSLLTAKVINALLGTKQDVLTEGQGINISNNEISTPVSTTSTTISQQSVNKLKYDGKPILVDYAINDDSGRIIADTYATFNDLHTLDIGDITSSSNIYQTLYQNVYENDTTKKNVVIFSTEGFVDSATSLISSGEHIATPYQDNKILIDSVFVLNSDNSATTIISSDTVVIDLGTLSTTGGTLSSEILAQINNNLGSKSIIFEITSGGMSFTTSSYSTAGNSVVLSFLQGFVALTLVITLTTGEYTLSQATLLDTLDVKTINNTSLVGAGNIEVQEPLVSGTNIKTVNEQSLVGSGNISVQEKLVSGTNIKTVNGQTILGSGNIEISGGGEALFEIIDLTSETNYKSISAIYNYMKNTVILDDYPISFNTSYYDAIETVISSGKIPILKFTDGYGYYQNNGTGHAFTFNLYFNESMEKMGHTMQLSINAVANEGIDAFCGLKDVKQIPYIWVKEKGFSGTSGTLTSTEVQSLLATFVQASAEGTVINAIQDVSNGQLYVIDYFAQSSSTATLTGHIYHSEAGFHFVMFLKINVDLSTFVGTWTIESFSFDVNDINISDPLSLSGTLEQDVIKKILRVFSFTSMFQLNFRFSNEQYRASLAHYDNVNTYDFYAFNADTNLITYKLSVNSNTKQYTLTKITTAESPKAYTVNIEFTNFIEGGTATLSDPHKNILERARVNGASVVYDSVLDTYYRLLYTETSTNLTLLYSTLDNELGIIEVNTQTGVATIKKVFKTGKNSTINLDTISNTKTNYDNVFNYLVEQGFARAYFNVEGFLDQENGIGNEQYYEAYLSGDNKYFASCGKIYEYIVDTSSQGFHVKLVGNSLFRPISKNTLRFKGNEILKISPTSTLTNVSILLGANVSKGQKKYTFDNPRMNFQLKPSFDNSFAFDTSTKEINIAESIYTKLFTWSFETDTVVPTVSSTKVSTWYPTNWHKGTTAGGKITATILDFSNLPSGTTYNAFFEGFNEFPDPISFKFNSLVDKYQEYRTFRFSLRFVFDYQGVKRLTTDKSYSKKWTGTLQNKYLEVIARLDYTNKQVVIYQRIRTFA